MLNFAEIFDRELRKSRFGYGFYSADVGFRHGRFGGCGYHRGRSVRYAGVFGYESKVASRGYQRKGAEAIAVYYGELRNAAAEIADAIQNVGYALEHGYAFAYLHALGVEKINHGSTVVHSGGKRLAYLVASGFADAARKDLAVLSDDVNGIALYGGKARNYTLSLGVFAVKFVL